MISTVRVDLPTGTVTLLFTDIEGSTGLIEELGEGGYVEALTLHRRLLRAAFVAHGGVEVDTQGDAFLYAFADPVEALAAAAQGQESLAPGHVKVRMGLHTGELQLTDEGYAGRELHRAARIAASGHGGQIVMSAAMRLLVDGALTELGEHRLKDFDEPVGLFQFGSERFPPLKTISNTNLPRPASSFVGRARERDELLDLLENGSRLVTLSGPGGSGKTRLALEVASELVPAFKAGVFWIGLSALRDPALVTETIAQTLGAKHGLAEHISERELLLLLDNFEQVVEAAPELSKLLEACPNLKLLVTSRELLRINGEVDYPVHSLGEPDAVELFYERSRLEADETISRLCQQLDNLPLAVELAAARTRVLTPTQILDRLTHRLDLFKGGSDADPRQQTLRATIEWSHDLLTGDEQRLFARLAVFAGGCTLDGAADVCDADLDLLQSLLDKSLLRRTGDRFWMLETIRQYAAEQLEELEDGEAVRRRHADYFLRLAEEAEPHLTGAKQAPWLERLEAEHQNLRLSLDSLRQAGLGAEELRLVGALMRFWYVRGHLREGCSRCGQALAAYDDQSPARLKALFGAGLFAHRLGDYQQADAFLDERLELARRLDDAEGVANSLIGLGLAAHGLGDYERAAAVWTEGAALARAGGYIWDQATAIYNLGELALEQGNYAEARARIEESLALYRESGDERKVVETLAGLGVLASREGRIDEAEVLLRESLEYAEALVDKEVAIWCLGELAALTVSKGDAERGARLTGAVETLREETGHAPQPEERRLDEQTRSTLSSALGEERLATALTSGREMTFEQAVAYALQT